MSAHPTPATHPRPTRPTALRHAGLLLAIVLAACSADSDGGAPTDDAGLQRPDTDGRNDTAPPDDTATPDTAPDDVATTPDAAPDAPRDTATPDASTNAAVDIVLTNTNQQHELQVRTTTRANTPGWYCLLPATGRDCTTEALPIHRRCGGIPACDGTTLPDCGVDEALQRIAPAASIDARWDGTLWEIDDRRGCQKKAPAATGSYRIGFLYEYVVDDEIKPPTNVQIDFVLGTATRVEQRAE